MIRRDDWQRLFPWWQALRTEQSGMLLGWGLMLITALAGIGLLGVSGWFITACAVVTGALNVFTPGAAIRGFALIRTLARYGERLATHDVVLRVQNHWRLLLFRGLLHRPHQQADKFRHSHILQRLTQDLSAMDDLYLRIAAPISVALLSAVLVILLGIVWLPWVSLLVCMGLLLTLLGCFFALPAMRRIQGLELHASEQLRDSALNVASGQAERYAWRLDDSALTTLRRHTSELATITATGRRQEQRLSVITETLLHGIFLLTLASALYAMQQGLISAPVAALLGFLVLGLADTWMAMVTATVSSARVLEAARRLEADVNNIRQPDIVEQQSMSLQAPSITIDSAIISGREQCPPWTLQLVAGQINWLTQPSGRGKSSLAFALSGELELVAGQIEWSHPARVSLLTQYNAVLSASLRDNLLMGADIPDTELRSIIEAVELSALVRAFPDGLDTWLGDGGHSLSGGQMRRLCLARALIRPAGVLVLDEPFSAIDPQQARRIFASIRPWMDGKTTLIISHTVL